MRRRQRTREQRVGADCSAVVGTARHVRANGSIHTARSRTKLLVIHGMVFSMGGIWCTWGAHEVVRLDSAVGRLGWRDGGNLEGHATGQRTGLGEVGLAIKREKVHIKLL